MQSYLDLLEYVRETGVMKPNRTGISAQSTFFVPFAHDMSEGFPLLTTKKMAWKAIVGELVGFLRGYDNAAQFRELNCKIWDQNANENEYWLSNPNRKGHDDLGRIYGVQWRDFKSVNQDGTIKSTDQIENVINTLKTNPNDRRMLVTAFNPGEMDQQALPPCHVMYQFWANEDKLSLAMYQRSCDAFLGIPFNIASYGLLLEIIAHLTNMEPDMLNIVFGDTHIYENHFEQVDEQIDRMPYFLPDIIISDELTDIDDIKPEHIILENYEHHDALLAPMAV